MAKIFKARVKFEHVSRLASLASSHGNYEIPGGSFSQLYILTPDWLKVQSQRTGVRYFPVSVKYPAAAEIGGWMYRVVKVDAESEQTYIVSYNRADERDFAQIKEAAQKADLECVLLEDCGSWREDGTIIDTL